MTGCELPGAPHRPETSVWKQPLEPARPPAKAPAPHTRLDWPVWVWRIIVAVQARARRA
jgi:hypothetical protein